MINEVNLKNKVINELQTIADNRYLWYTEKIEKKLFYISLKLLIV
ncbi:hypothetical protein LAD12857_11650 [Lacrimispora amygdalina]|uniref:Uncharacterized protein n=1 Tax=Lacrimispora amygdalina TaxID=253257 RepID=A0ABQ5M306_9FIRM